MNRTVIYTAIFGGYDELREPVFVPKNCDFVCFTDRPQKSKIWQMHIVDPPVPGDMTRSNRRIKILAHEYVPEYEYSVYLDGTFLVHGDVNELVEKYLENANMAAYPHPERRCIYEEAEAVVRAGKDGPEVVRRQMMRYRAEGYPARNGLIMSGILVRRHHAPDVRRTMELWWREESTQSKRDQLSFNYAAWRTSLPFVYIPGNLKDNPYLHRRRHQKVERGARALLWKIVRKLRAR